jgi:hypothetical protein
MEALDAPVQFVEMNLNETKKHDDNYTDQLESSVSGDNTMTLAHAISTQPWETIGQKEIIFEGVLMNKQDDHDDLVNQIVAILEMRLAALVSSRTSVMGALVRTRSTQDEIEDGLSPSVREELRAYVAQIASLYRNVHYHAFPHAAHVSLSVNRLIQLLLDSKEVGEGGSSTATTVDTSTDSLVAEKAEGKRVVTRRRSITRRITLQHIYCLKNASDEKKIEDLVVALPRPTRKEVMLSSKAVSVRGTMALAEVQEVDDCTALERHARVPKPKVHSAAALFNRTSGLSVDPLSHFASVFSALVHDVEHQVSACYVMLAQLSCLFWLVLWVVVFAHT